MTIEQKHTSLAATVAEYEALSGVTAQAYRALTREPATLVAKIEAFASDLRWFEKHTGHIHQKANRGITAIRE